MNSLKEKYTLVDTPDAFETLLDTLSLYDMAALDTEADSMHHYQVRLCLIQITVGESHFLVDPFADLDFSRLFAAKAMQTLIIHGADYDLRMLWLTYGFTPKSVFDTMIAARFLNEEKVGLAGLVEKYFGEALEKENQKADWTIRPLPTAMCEYAAYDTFFLHELCAILGEKLQKLGRFYWLTETCDAVIETAKHPPKLKEEPWRITGSSYFSSKELHILKTIWNWRETEARLADKQPYKVLSPGLMLAVVRMIGREKGAIRWEKIPKMPRHLNEGLLDKLKVQVESALTEPESVYPEPYRMPKQYVTNPDSLLIEAIRFGRDLKSLELDLESSMIANKNQLTALAMPGKTWEERFESAGLLNWQKKVWKDILAQHHLL